MSLDKLGLKTGLYIHIPFCRKKCVYCNFTSFEQVENLIPDYLKSLDDEISYIGQQSTASIVSTIYLGGGAPTLLSGDQIIRISDGIRKNFDIDKNCEFTIEANPGTIDKDKLEAIKKAGINRLSIGAQSFDNNELKYLGRIHDSNDIKNSFSIAREAGFNNINIDLIFSIPGQTEKSWLKSLKETIKLKPSHISAYDLEIEEGTPLFKKLSDKYIPDNELEHSLYEETINYLKENGYIQYEISNFCLPGFECGHNINYWKNGDYIGLGTAASSHINGERFQNTKDIPAYIKDPVKQRQKENRTVKDEISETLFMGLRMIKGVNTTDFKKRFKSSIEDVYKKEIDGLTELKLIEIKNDHLKLTNKGLFLANEVFERFV